MDKQGIGKLSLEQNEQLQIQAMLQQTVISDSKYTDNEINHLINPNLNQIQQKSSVKNSIHSQFSAASQSDQNSYQIRTGSIGSQNKSAQPKGSQQNDSIDSEFDFGYQNQEQYKIKGQPTQYDINTKFLKNFKNGIQQYNIQMSQHQARFNNLKQQNTFPYKKLYEELDYLQSQLSEEQVQKIYPSFLISKPLYKIGSTVKQSVHKCKYQQNQCFEKIDINHEQNNFYVMANYQHKNFLSFFELNNTNKPVLNIEVFPQGQNVNFFKWSSQMMYLVVSSCDLKVKVFQFRQIVKIQAQIQLKWLKNPIQVFTIQNPKIKKNIIDGHFISENPLKVILVDQEYEIYVVQLKKHFISYKPVINKLPIKFNYFYQMKTRVLYDQIGKSGTLLLVGGQQYVTLALIQPKFEIVLVFDKEKHFPNAKGNNFPHIMILQNSQFQDSQQKKNYINVGIVWDKYLEIFQLKIQSIEPLMYRVKTILKYTFPDSSLIFGNLSDTIFYQVTRLEIKFYSISELSKFNQVGSSVHNNIKPEEGILYRKRFAEPMHVKRISFSDFNQHQRIQEMISNKNLTVTDLNLLRKLFSVSNNTLFICFKHQIHSFQFQSFPFFIQNTIEKINDWRNGLQLLCGGILKQITNYDNLHQPILKKQLKQYSSRYIQFLKGVIPDVYNNNEIWKQQMYFLFSILIDTDDQSYLLKDILLKLYRLSPQLLKILEPFILLGRINQIEVQTLDLILSVLDRNARKRFIYLVRNSKKLEAQSSQRNEMIAHSINNILIRYEMYLEIIWINQFFGDFYTPFVILISKYEQEYGRKQIQRQKQLQSEMQSEGQLNKESVEISSPLIKYKKQKQILILLIGFLTYETLRLINFSDYRRHNVHEQKFYLSKTKAKYLLETVVPLMNQKLNNVLITNCSDDFFDFILEELYVGNCLSILNQLGDLDRSGELVMVSNNGTIKKIFDQIIQKIPFRLILESKNQGKYWLFIIRLMIRKLVSRKIIQGVYYLTLEYQKQNESLVKLMDLFVRNCYDVLQEELNSIDLEKKTQLFQKLKDSQHSELLKLLGSQLSREIQVVQCLIKSKRCHNIDLIYYVKSLLQNIKQLSSSQQKGVSFQLKQILKTHIKLFTLIDPQKTSNIIIKNYKQQMKQFISYLDQNPKQQLNLLKQILNHYNYGEFLNRQKCKYLQLLAINGKKDIILEEIKQHMFPLDQAIEICRKYEILDAWAFLLVKSGGSGDAKIAIQIYFKIVKEHIQVYKYNRKSYQNWLQLQNLMLNQLGKCIQICIQLDLKGNSHYQAEWFYIIQQLQTLKKHIYKTCSPQVQSSIRQIILSALYPALIRQLLDEVSQENLVSYLYKSINSLELDAVSLIIGQMVKGYFYQKQILKNAQQQISNSQIQQRKQLYKSINLGFLTWSRCYQCMKKDSQTKIHYSCGHDIHPACNQDVKECISCKDQVDSLIWKQINTRDKVEKLIYYNGVDPNKNISQKDIVRLSRNQKLRQFDQALANYKINSIAD